MPKWKNNEIFTAMNDVIFPTCYFPPVATAAAMAQKVDNGILTIEQQETFPKQTHRNRTVIVTANGPMTLSVPVVRPRGNHTLTSEVTISYAEKWNRVHWRAIVSAYNASPYFLYYRDEVEDIIMRRHERLLDLNDAILTLLTQKLKLHWQRLYTEDYLKGESYATDYRDKYSYKHPERLPSLETYHQVFSDRFSFNPNVGILDLLFNMGPESVDYLRHQRL